MSSKERIIIAIILFSLIGWPLQTIKTAHAQTETQQKSLVFEIKSQSEIQTQNNQTQTDTTTLTAEAAQKAEMNEEVILLRTYLQSKNSPFANYTEILLAQPDWKTIIAVSNAESNMGIHCYVNNCSGIFGHNGLRTYNSIPDWMTDMQTLLSAHYQNMTLDQMDGKWVYPRSTNWYKASSKVYNDVTAIEEQAQSSAT